MGVARLPLGNGEAYYATVVPVPRLELLRPSAARRLDGAGLTTVFGASPAAVRLGPVLASGALRAPVSTGSAERLVRPRAALLALVLVTALPVFLRRASSLNPEAPLAPLWVGYLLVLEGMRERDEPFARSSRACSSGPRSSRSTRRCSSFRRRSSTSRSRRQRAAGCAGRRLYAGGAHRAPRRAAGARSGTRRAAGRRSGSTSSSAPRVGVPVAGENAINHWWRMLVIERVGAASRASCASSSGRSCRTRRSSRRCWSSGSSARSVARARDDRDLFLASFSWPVLLLAPRGDAPGEGRRAALDDGGVHSRRPSRPGGTRDEAWVERAALPDRRGGGVALSFAGFVVGDRSATHSTRCSPHLRPPTTTRGRTSRTRWPAGTRSGRASSGRAHAADAAAATWSSRATTTRCAAGCSYETGDAPNGLLPHGAPLGVRLLRPPDSACGRHRRRAHERHPPGAARRARGARVRRSRTRSTWSAPGARWPTTSFILARLSGRRRRSARRATRRHAVPRRERS